MKRIVMKLVTGAALAGVAGAATAQVPTPLAAPAGAVAIAPPSVAPAVAAYYQRFPARIWLKAGAENPAIEQLALILDRAPFDGFAEGPLLAAEVRAAQSAARAGQPAAIDAAERTISAAWVTYLQHMKRQTAGMVYVFQVLVPQGARPDQILLNAANAPSLQAYLTSASGLNVPYAQLRDAAALEASAKGVKIADPRLIANLDRLRSIPATGRFMVVDSGTQMVTLYDNGKPFDAMKVVVGKIEYPTPMIASIMYYMVYNPYWNAPDHLARKIAQNYLSMGDSYLRSKGYQVMKDWSTTSAILPNDQVDWKGIASGKVFARIRQKPSDDNSMGDLKFPFVNDLDIFLHDTPHKEYFTRTNRGLSNGCVRLEDARRFARWVSGAEPTPPSDGAEIQVQLPRGIPIYLTYTTAMVRDGKIAYFADPYRLDPSVLSAKAGGAR
ncbi:MAG: L,D-transpeptidase family protein [Sphingomicrobium sp.]